MGQIWGTLPDEVGERRGSINATIHIGMPLSKFYGMNSKVNLRYSEVQAAYTDTFDKTGQILSKA